MGQIVSLDALAAGPVADPMPDHHPDPQLDPLPDHPQVVALGLMRASEMEIDSMVEILAARLHPQVHLQLIDHPFSADLRYPPDLDPAVPDLTDPLRVAALDLLADPVLVDALDLPADLVLEAVPDPPDPLADPDLEADQDPPVDPVSVVTTVPLADPVSVDVPVDPDLHPHLLHPDLTKIPAEAAVTVASRAPNPVLAGRPGPMALLQLTGRTPKDRPCSTNSKVPTGINSVPVGSEISTIRSVRRFANVPVCSGTLQIVTNSTSVIGTSGWRNTPCTCSLAPSF